MIGCPEEIAYQKHWIDKEELLSVARKMNSSKYGIYLESLIDET
jgi:dTDP-glucose pyrophosphorylase